MKPSRHGHGHRHQQHRQRLRGYENNRCPIATDTHHPHAHTHAHAHRAGPWQGETRKDRAGEWGRERDNSLVIAQAGLQNGPTDLIISIIVESPLFT